MRWIGLVIASTSFVVAGCSSAPDGESLGSVEDAQVVVDSPAGGFSPRGNLRGVVRVAKGYHEQSILDPKGKKGPGDVVLTARGEGCPEVRPGILSSGTVAPVRVNPQGKPVEAYLWTVDVNPCLACARPTMCARPLVLAVQDVRQAGQRDVRRRPRRRRRGRVRAGERRARRGGVPRRPLRARTLVRVPLRAPPEPQGDAQDLLRRGRLRRPVRLRPLRLHQHPPEPGRELRRWQTRVPSALLAIALVGCGAPVGDEPDAGEPDAATIDPLDAARAVDLSERDATVGAVDAALDATPPSDLATAAGPTRYPTGALHGPLTAPVLALLDKVLAGSPGRRDVFAKVGASNTVNTNFLHCFAGDDVKLDASAALEPTRAHFRKTKADGARTSFDRTSLAATVGWTAGKPIAGNPSPLDQEIAAIRPAFAVVMLGTNDTYDQGVVPFEKNLRGVVDACTARGVVPILSTIPPRGDTAAANALVPEMNAIIRAVAQARQVPYVDLWQTLTGLPKYGLVGDGVHLGVFVDGGRARGCWLTPPALQHGMNQRNRVTLAALDRARRFLVEKSAPAEAAPPPLVGEGTWQRPFEVDALPFVDAADTRTGSLVAKVYSCAPQDEGGPEIVYRVVLGKAAKLRARVFSDDGADADLHWLDGPSPDRCLARADRLLDLNAAAGTYFLAVDTYVDRGKPLPGPYRLTLVAQP